MVNQRSQESGRNRREFSRIQFDSWAELQQGERVWNAKLIDISLQGLLVEEPRHWDADPNLPLTSIIALNDEFRIVMRVQYVHRERRHVGFKCLFMDIDSVSCLRRLIELNLGDPNLVERELVALFGHDEAG